MGIFSWCGGPPKDNLSKKDQKMKEILSPDEFKKYMRNKTKERARYNTNNRIKEENNSCNRYIEECRRSYAAVQSNMCFKYQGTYNVTISGKKMLLWITDGELKAIEAYPPTIQLECWHAQKQPVPKWVNKIISVPEIEYFTAEGEIYTETKISGGETKPLNLADVAIAGAIAGSTGAIIVSRPKNTPITSETIRHDDRKTILVYNRGKLEFAPEDYAVLMKLIPEKEFSVVQQKRAMQTEKPAVKDDSIDTLRKLKVMLEEGLISQEEYNAKKKEILGRM